MAHAQEADGRDAPIAVQDIVVTAQKRVERLVDTPQTVNVVSGEALEELNLTRFDDLDKVVPGLSITRGSGREQAVSLRGVAFDPDSQTSRTVDIYLNEVPFDPTQALQAQFDIGAIQVLRGPQGTLRGGTGPSGAILIGTRQPDLAKVAANGSASYTDLRSLNLQGGVNVPVIADKLAVRVAGLYDRSRGDGVRNLVTGQEDLSRSYAGRVSVLFQPTDDFSVMLMHQQFRAKTDNLLGVASTAGLPVGQFGKINVDNRLALTLGGNRFETKGQATILNATWDVAGHRLSYIGSYQDNEFNTDRDLNLGGVLTPGWLAYVPGLGGFANKPYQEYQRIDTRVKSLTNELRFERTGSHFWLYRFGVFFNDTKSPFSGVIDYTGANGNCLNGRGALGLAVPQLPCMQLGGGVTPETKERGYFTTQTFNFTDNDTLDVGLRYSTASTFNPPDNSEYNAWTGTASYRHRFNDAAIAYASYGRSFRPGGFDSSGAAFGAGAGGIPVSFFTFGKEVSDSFEVGLKGAVFNNRLIYAVSAFYQKFDGYIARTNNISCNNNPQVDTSPTGCAGTGGVNLTYKGNAIVKGMEFDVRGQITRNWNAHLTLTYADAHFDNAAIPCNDYNNDGAPDTLGAPSVQPGKYISTCVSNASLSNLAKFQGTLSSEYTVDLPDNFGAFARGLGRYRSSSRNPNTGLQTPGAVKVDAFLGVRTPVGAEISLFVRNLFDERNDVVEPGQIYDVLGTGSGYSHVTYDQRREFGLQLRLDF